MRSISIALALSALVSCTAQIGDLAPESKNVDVELVWRDGVLEIGAVSPATGAPSVLDPHARRIGYELVTPAGVVIATGAVPDPRGLRFEYEVSGQLRKGETSPGVVRFKVRVPREDGTIILRDHYDARPIASVPLSPASQIGEVAAAIVNLRDDIVGTQRMSGPPDGDALDIALLAEGYTRDELPRFAEQAQLIVNGLLDHPDYAPYRDRIRLWRVDVVSRQSGVDDATNGRAVDTAFDVGFGSGSMPRRCLWFDNSAATPERPAGQSAAFAVGGLVNADIIAVVVNADDGGCAGGRLLTTAGADGAAILPHELGHALFGLQDEYVDETLCTGGTTGINVAAGFMRDQLPWGELVTTDELPTLSDLGAVGAWEGGGYCPTGLYRAQHECLMRSLWAPMCVACKRAAARFFGIVQDEPDQTGESDNPDQPDDSDRSNGRNSCGDGVCSPGVEDCGNCPGDCPCWQEGTTCQNNVCVLPDEDRDARGGCGDGLCEPGVEDCGTCPTDCPCWEPGTTCQNHICVLPGEGGSPPDDCGDGRCEPGVEDCGTCLRDCPCRSGTTCEARVCVAE